MSRLLPVVALVIVSTGCAGTADLLTSRKFREKPFGTMFNPGDPLTVMRTSPEGDERAAAMRRLKEPVLEGRPQEEQDEALRLLSAAATTDPSPVVRVAAVDALGRFQDERAVEVLTAAYHQAAGATKSRTGPPADRLSLAGPTGFAPEMVTIIQTRVVESLAGTGRTEAVPMLTRVATGQTEGLQPDRDVRLAAVRGLTKMRVPESAVALAQVLSTEKGKDPALAGRAHEGLVNLTGQSHPADPAQWEAVIQAGVTVVPEPDAVQRAAAWVANP